MLLRLCLGSAWCREIISRLRTHLGSWLPLLPLRSSPPRAALPVDTKNIITFIAL